MKKNRLRSFLIILFILVLITLPLFGKAHARLERLLISNDINRILKQEVSTHSQGFKDLLKEKGVQFFIQRDSTQRAYFQSLSATNLQQAQEIALAKPFTSMFTFTTTVKEESYTIVLVIPEQYPMIWMGAYSGVLLVLMFGIAKTKKEHKPQVIKTIEETPIKIKEVMVMNKYEPIDQAIAADYYVQMEQVLSNLHQAIGFTARGLDEKQMSQLMIHIDQRIAKLNYQVFTLAQLQKKEPQIIKVKEMFMDILKAFKRMDEETIQYQVQISVNEEVRLSYSMFMRMLYLMINIVRYDLKAHHACGFSIDEGDGKLIILGQSRREVAPNELFEQMCLVVKEDEYESMAHHLIEDAKLLMKIVHLMEGTCDMNYHLGKYDVRIEIPTRRIS